MLHLDFVCQHPQVVREALRRRRDPHTIDEILRLAEQRRGLITRCDGLYTSLKALKEDARQKSIEKVNNCQEFQAQRANIKYRPSQKVHADYVHTLNGSGLAVGRTMAALLENCQQADGSVVVPKVLRPYMQTSLLVSPV